jgi:hypothetical protein
MGAGLTHAQDDRTGRPGLGGCDYETEGSLNCTGADAAGSFVEWVLEGGFFLAWLAAWFLGFEVIRFLGRRSDRDPV